MMQAASTRTDRTSTDRPRFRQDLFAEVIDEQGARFIDVMDPDSGNLFRFYEVEYSLACGMDGERDVAGIVKWAHDELGLSPSTNEVRAVIAQLGELGFIASAEAEAAAAASAEAEPELAQGVVAAAAAQPADDVEDVELGTPGATEAPAPIAAAPIAPPVALGAPGAGTQRRPSEPVEDVALGAPGRRPEKPTPSPDQVSDVSIDLADHIEVKADDVKEAVRQSRIMAAVEPPPEEVELARELPRSEERTVPSARMEVRVPDNIDVKPPEPTRPEPARPEPVRPEPRVEVKPPVKPEVRAESKPKLEPESSESIEIEAAVAAATAAPSAKPPYTRMPSAKPPVELPAPPMVDKVPEKTAVVPPAPKQGSPALLVLLILLVIGVGAFAVWKFILSKPGASATSSAPVVPAAKPSAPPAPPPPPTAKIAMDAAQPEDVKAGRAGVIETIQADKFEAKAGDTLAILVGDRPIQAEITALTASTKKLQDAVAAATKRQEAAQASGNKADEAKATKEIADKQKVLTEKQSALEAKKTELDNFLLRATGNGTFTPSAKQGAKITAEDVVGKLQRDPTPVATFKIADAKAFAVDANIDVAVGKGDASVTCKIAEVQAQSLKVTCPADAQLADGTDVTLKLPNDLPITAPPAADAVGSAAGSGSAAEAK